MSFSMGKLRIRMHPLLPLLWGFSVLIGGGLGLLAALSALLLHETGHVMTAKWLCIPIVTLEITPFGGVMTSENLESVSPASRFLFAAAGPVFSLLGCFFSAILYRWSFPFAFVQRFARANLLLLIINLLPALPLDGGEMLRALLTIRFPWAIVTRALTAAGYAAGFLLGAVSLAAALRGELILYPLFAGLYLIYAVSVERKESTARYVTALIARRQKLDKNEVLPVELLAVGADTPARMILPRLSMHKYHVIHVLSPDGMKRLGQLDENAFCDLVLSRPNDPVGNGIKE